jgi:hypothetical protein
MDEPTHIRDDQVDAPTSAAVLNIVLIPDLGSRPERRAWTRLPRRRQNRRTSLAPAAFATGMRELAADDMITAFYLEAEQRGRWQGPAYDVDHGLRRFSAWLDQAPDPADVAPARPVIMLAAAAVTMMRQLPDPVREELAEALETELEESPNSGIEVTFRREAPADPESLAGAVSYTATPLSAFGYTAIHRRLTADEIGRQQEDDQPTADQGFYVLDILPATTPGPALG